MKLLLDTQLLLWAAGQPERLPVGARRVIDDARNQLMFSATSLWEVAIKSGRGRADFRADARLLRRGLLDNGYDDDAELIKALTKAKPACFLGPLLPKFA